MLKTVNIQDKSRMFLVFLTLLPWHVVDMRGKIHPYNIRPTCLMGSVWVDRSTNHYSTIKPDQLEQKATDPRWSQMSPVLTEGVTGWREVQSIQQIQNWERSETKKKLKLSHLFQEYSRCRFTQQLELWPPAVAGGGDACQCVGFG